MPKAPKQPTLKEFLAAFPDAGRHRLHQAVKSLLN